MGLSGDELAAWVEASCEAQGVPVKVNDAQVVQQVVALLGRPGGRGRAKPCPPGARSFPEPPETAGT